MHRYRTQPPTVSSFRPGRLEAVWCGVALLLFLIFHSGAATDNQSDPALPRPLSPQDGSVDAGGKFTPRGAPGATNVLVPKTRAEAEAALQQTLGVKQTGLDSFTIGRVKFDKKERTVTIPAQVNVRQSLLEYALVTETGKRHEALLVTEAKPEHVHLACLLLGLAPAESIGELGQRLKVPAANAVKIEVTWDKHGPPAQFPLAQLIGLLNRTNRSELTGPLAEGDWFYNGSSFNVGGFLAQQEGSIISLISDPAALINNPRSDRSNDDIHVPNIKMLPPENTPVRVILRLPPPEKSPGTAPSKPQ